MGSGGVRQRRRSSRAMISSCSGSGKRAQRRSGLTPLQQHRTEIIVSIEQPHGWITIPKTQAFNLVLALHVRHAELQHGGPSGRERHRRHPRATDVVAIEGSSDGEGPSAFQIAEGCRPVARAMPTARVCCGRSRSAARGP